jgi:hypothetical protein
MRKTIEELAKDFRSGNYNGRMLKARLLRSTVVLLSIALSIESDITRHREG